MTVRCQLARSAGTPRLSLPGKTVAQVVTFSLLLVSGAPRLITLGLTPVSTQWHQGVAGSL